MNRASLFRLSLAWLLGSCVAACGSDKEPAATQLVITVDSNLKMPDEIDRLTLDVTGLVKAVHTKADLLQHDLPRTLTLVHDGGPLGPIRVAATGWIGDIKVVESIQDTAFEGGKTVALNIELDRSCRNYFCDSDMTCKAGKCVAIETPEPDAGGFPEPDSGPDKTPDATTPEDAGKTPPPPVDAGKIDAGPKNQAPKCTIASPNDGEDFTTTESVLLQGSCTDAESGALTGKALHWIDGSSIELGTGSEITLPALDKGTQTFQLCATDPEDSTLSDCDEVTITIALPDPPTATITDVFEAKDDTSPFLPKGPVSFVGEATGEGVEYTWTDSFVGEFGNNATAKLSKPEVGRHRVTLTVTDDVGQTAEDTVTFQVLEAGDTLVHPFENVNSTLTDGASVLAADSAAQVLAASGTTLYRFDATSTTASAEPAITGTLTLGTITAIHIWEPDAGQALVYLGTTTGLVVCNYSAGALIDATMCTTYVDGDWPSNEITSIVRATVNGDDTLMVGTAKGLFVPDDVKGASTGDPDIFSGDERVTAIVVSQDLFWFTGDMSGLFYYDPSNDKLHAAADPLDGPSLDLESIAADESGAIWVGSSDGVGRYDPEEKRWDTWKAGDEPAPGLADDQVNALATTHVTLDGDAHDVVWIGTDSGVSRIDFDVPSFMTLDEADSLPSDKVTAVVVLPDGSKVFATDEGVALYTGS